VIVLIPVTTLYSEIQPMETVARHRRLEPLGLLRQTILIASINTDYRSPADLCVRATRMIFKKLSFSPKFLVEKIRKLHRKFDFSCAQETLLWPPIVSI
jgi:hypothetical protein